MTKKQLTYRPFQNSDTKDLISVIIQSWDYDSFLKPQIANHFAHLFLYYELSRASFNQVAVMDNQAVGIIVGEIKDQTKPTKNKAYWLKMIYHASKLLLSKDGRKLLYHYVYGSQAVNKNLLEQLHTPFEAELAFFTVSPLAQGQGVGSNLYQIFLDSLQQNQLSTFFLYTDTSCNYRFYDKKGLSRLSEATNYMPAPINKQMTSFIYGGGTN